MGSFSPKKVGWEFPTHAPVWGEIQGFGVVFLGWKVGNPGGKGGRKELIHPNPRRSRGGKHPLLLLSSTLKLPKSLKLFPKTAFPWKIRDGVRVGSQHLGKVHLGWHLDPSPMDPSSHKSPNYSKSSFLWHKETLGRVTVRGKKKPQINENSRFPFFLFLNWKEFEMRKEKWDQKLRERPWELGNSHCFQD